MLSVTPISILSIPNSKLNQKSTHNSNIINSVTPNLTNSIHPKSISHHNSIYKSTNHFNSNFKNSIHSVSTNSIYTEPINQNNTYISKSKIPINPQGQVNVTTRNRPCYNTFEKQITIRKRAPNKSKSKMAANKSNTQTIAAQTEDSSNKGQGRSPIRPDPSNPIFPLSNATNMPQNRKNLAQVFGEEFVAKATTKDKKWRPLLSSYESAIGKP